MEATHPEAALRSKRELVQVESGSLSETVAGAAALVLAILALIGVLPYVLGPIAAMAAGVALLTGGGGIAARALSVTRERAQLLGSVGMEALAGASGAVLGLLALVGVSTLSLLSITAIVLGAALIMSSAALVRLESITAARARTEQTMERAVYVASGSDFLIGVGSMVLGILALTGYSPLVLSLVGLLGIGAAAMLSGSTTAGRFLASLA